MYGIPRLSHHPDNNLPEGHLDLRLFGHQIQYRSKPIEFIGSGSVFIDCGQYPCVNVAVVRQIHAINLHFFCLPSSRWCAKIFSVLTYVPENQPDTLGNFSELRTILRLGCANYGIYHDRMQQTTNTQLCSCLSTKFYLYFSLKVVSVWTGRKKPPAGKTPSACCSLALRFR